MTNKNKDFEDILEPNNDEELESDRSKESEEIDYDSLMPEDEELEESTKLEEENSFEPTDEDDELFKVYEEPDEESKEVEDLEGQLEQDSENDSGNLDEEEKNINEEFERNTVKQETPKSTLKNKDVRSNLIKYIIFSILVIVMLVWFLQSLAKKFVGGRVENTQRIVETSASSSQKKFDPFDLNKGTDNISKNDDVEDFFNDNSNNDSGNDSTSDVDFSLLKARSSIGSSNVSNVGAVSNSSDSEETIVKNEAADPFSQLSELQKKDKNTLSKDRYSGINYELATAEKIPFNPNLVLEKGTFIPCAMNTRFISTIAGEISCTIVDDVYSANGNVLLIEKGSKAFGQFNSASLERGENRMFVIWNEIRTPNKIRIAIDSNATGELGESGASLKVDNHFIQRFGGALLVSFISNLSNFAAATLADRASKRENASNMQQMRDRQASDTSSKVTEIITTIIQKEMDIAPTGYKNQGEIIGIFVSRDVDFSNVYYLRRHRR